MGKKSNLNTIQSKINFNLYNFNSKFYILGLSFLKAFKQLLHRKSVLLCFENFNFYTNKIMLTASIFYKSNQLKFYKKHKSFSLLYKKNKTFTMNKNDLNFAVKKINTIFLTNTIIYNLTVLNNKLNKKLLSFLLKNLKVFLTQLFSRRFSLFLDFIKLTSLFFYSEIDCKTFLYSLTEIFKFLRKKHHSRFFSFVKTLFSLLTTKLNSFKSIKHLELIGMKLLIKGRLKGKPMASNLIINEGLMPLQTLSKNLEFTKAHTFTQKFGVFGFKFWIYKK
jgi:hypothetical protein